MKLRRVPPIFADPAQEAAFRNWNLPRARNQCRAMLAFVLTSLLPAFYTLLAARGGGPIDPWLVADRVTIGVLVAAALAASLFPIGTRAIVRLSAAIYLIFMLRTEAIVWLDPAVAGTFIGQAFVVVLFFAFLATTIYPLLVATQAPHLAILLTIAAGHRIALPFGIAAWAAIAVMVCGCGVAIGYHQQVSRRRDFLAFLRAEALERQLREQVAALDLANAAKSRLLAMVSHELRTPMNGVIGTLQLLTDEPEGPARARYLAAALGSAEALLGVVDALLDYAQLDQGATTLESRPFRIADIVGRAVDLLRHRAEAKSIGLAATIHAGASEALRGDERRIGQIVINLIDNAIKFTETGAVTVAARVGAPEGGLAMLEISVADTGIGIPAEQLAAVFHEFVQADPSIARRFGGSGLGLAIARILAERMGGTLAVESRVGAGSVFTLRLPLPPAQAPIEPPRPPAGTPSLRVLLVEDDAINRMVAQGLLERLGHRVTALPGAAGVATSLSANPPDLVLLDLHMPRIDGIEAARRIQTLSPAIPIVALTADVTEEARQGCAEAGIAAILTKPLRLADLAEILDGIAPQRPALTDLPR
jgi:signal transduction histidine kinase